jgi:hypothetical protein
MIESCYWKEDLLAHSKRLAPVTKPSRWTEGLAVRFEREIIISFFCIRKLFDEHKVSSASKSHKAIVYISKSKGKNVTRMNSHRIDELYDFENEKEEKKGIYFLTNQFVHSYIIFPYRNEDRNWGGLFICSDYERNSMLLRIGIDEVRKILNVVGSDYPHTVKMTFDPKLQDYKVETN